MTEKKSMINKTESPSFVPIVFNWCELSDKPLSILVFVTLYSAEMSKYDDK